MTKCVNPAAEVALLARSAAGLTGARAATSFRASLAARLAGRVLKARHEDPQFAAIAQKARQGLAASFAGAAAPMSSTRRIRDSRPVRADARHAGPIAGKLPGAASPLSHAYWNLSSAGRNGTCMNPVPKAIRPMRSIIFAASLAALSVAGAAPHQRWPGTPGDAGNPNGHAFRPALPGGSGGGSKAPRRPASSRCLLESGSASVDC